MYNRYSLHIDDEFSPVPAFAGPQDRPGRTGAEPAAAPTRPAAPPPAAAGSAGPPSAAPTSDTYAEGSLRRRFSFWFTQISFGEFPYTEART